MTFIYPLGLLGLLGIPVLIIIYIIKNKYTEQIIPSTYMWKLSERFLKRRNPINMVTGIISLILQILAIVFISLAIAHPVIIYGGQAADYCYIVDCSGSMSIMEEDATRLDRAKEYLEEAISSTKNGSTYTIIAAGETTEEYEYKPNVNGTKSYSQIKQEALDRAKSITGATVDNDLSSAIKSAQRRFNSNHALKIYLLTDKTVQGSENITTVNFAQTVNNFGVSAASYLPTEKGVKLTATVSSYGEGGKVTLQVFEDDSAIPVAESTKQLEAGKSSKLSLSWDSTGFSVLRVAIKEEDSLAADNVVYLYNTRQSSAYRTLIVSETAFFLTKALDVVGGVDYTVVKPGEYDSSMGSGYGLYVFENYSPKTLPSDGAVWFMNPPSTTSDTGFAVNGKEELESGVVVQFSKSTSTQIKKILDENCDKTEKIYLKQYVRCNLYGNFTTILSCNKEPVLMIGGNNFGNRQVIFAFDTQDTNFAVSYNYFVLINNLLNYTFPAIVDQTTYYCGESAAINVLANCKSIRVDAPGGKYSYLDTSSEMTECFLSEAGEYTVTALIGNETKTVKLYSQFPLSERATSASASYSVTGEASGEQRDGMYEDILYVFIVLAVIVVADWAVYCYEQYQLR